MSNSDAADPSHPEDAILSAWLAGKLHAALAEPIERHLEDCAECAARLDGLESRPDAFVAKLKAVTLSERVPQDASLPAVNDDLAFGVLAMQLGLIDRERFVDASVLWASRTGESLADVLVENSWVDPAGRRQIDEALERRRRSEGVAEPTADTIVGETGDRQPDNFLLGQLSSERLRLRQVHTSGGTGRVWRAFDVPLQREIALKELLPQYARSPVHRDRFHREACVAAQLAHPGTIPVHEYREEDGRCYYTMRFVSGRTLTDLIRAAHEAMRGGGDDPFARLFELLTHFVTICDTIAYAHSQGVIHRDLKGDNVLVGEFGEVTVIDWGLAKLFTPLDAVPLAPPEEGDSATLQGERLGTPAYMAPEQARGTIDEIDTRTDVYGLAAILYEILTGRPPFQGDTVHQIMHRVESDPPTPPRELAPNTPKPLEAICLQGLEKRREDRQQTAAEVRDEVRYWMTHQTDRRREAESRAQFFSLSQDLFVTLAADGRVTHVNPAYERLLSRPADEVVDLDYRDTLHPDDRARSEPVFRAALQGAAESDFVCRVQNAAGGYVPISWTVTRTPGDRAVYAVGRALDEESQRRRQQRERETFFSLSKDLFVSFDEDGAITHTNPAYDDFFGYDPKRSAGKSYLTKLHPEDKHLVTERFNAARRGEPQSDFVARVQRSTDEYSAISWTLTKIPGEPTTYAVGRPLDGEAFRRRAAEARARFFSLSDDLFVVSDHNGNAAQINAAWTRVLGWKPEDVVGRPHTEFIVGEDGARASRAARRALIRGSEVGVELTMRCRDGSTREIAWSINRVPGDTVIYTVGRDVTERRRIEQRLRVLLRESHEPLIVIDRHGAIERTNERLDTLFGYAESELVGEPFERLLDEHVREEHRARLRRYLEEPTVRSMHAQPRLPGMTKDGKALTLAVSLSPLWLDARLSVIAAMRPE
ncbi:MAG: PAS domain S-box protein [Planctomycetota bacterium]